MFKNLIWVSAIMVATMAAIFSVTGIATLFSAKFYAVVAMAASLEIGKLVMASYLYRWWKKTPILLKIYSVISVVILMGITSVGIYGYLSAAYAQVAAVPQNTLNEISFIDNRQQSLNEIIDGLRLDNTTVDSRISQVNAVLNDVLSGGTELSQRSAYANLQQEKSNLDEEKQINDSRQMVAIAERDSLEMVKVTLNAELNTNSDIGPFIYIARTLNLPLDVVVKWFVLIIVFVFDPLAISLILAYNNIVMKEQTEVLKKPENLSIQPDLPRSSFDIKTTQTIPIESSINSVKVVEQNNPHVEEPSVIENDIINEIDEIIETTVVEEDPSNSEDPDNLVSEENINSDTIIKVTAPTNPWLSTTNEFPPKP